MIHGPSIAIGSGITAVVALSVFFAFSFSEPEKELVIENGAIERTGPNPLALGVLLDNGSPLLGNPNAKVTLVEFGDYQCFFCNKHFHETEELLMENYITTGKVKMIFKDFNIIGPDSVSASNAAHCASEQNMFWEYHDTLYNHWTGENNGWAASENLVTFAEEMGLDMNKFNKCFEESRFQQKIDASNQDARTLELGGTPAFFVIGPDGQVTKIGGAVPYSNFASIFDAHLSK